MSIGVISGRGGPVDLPDDLALPLVSGAPHWYWVGGCAGLDLVNTLRERWRRRVECLVTPEDLALWLARTGLTEGADRPATGAQLARARRLREAIDAVVVALVVGRPPAAAAVAAIDGSVRRHGPRPGLSLVDGVPVAGSVGAPDPIDAALGRVAVEAVEILGGPRRERVRICAAEDCSARFLDLSRPGRRRWCTMAGCGNRAKARRLRGRR